MLTAILPLIVAIIGLVIYLVATTPLIVETGRILFWTGTLVTLFAEIRHTTNLGSVLIAYVPLVVAIIGLLIFAVASTRGNPESKRNPKFVEIGKILLWTGTLVTLFAQINHTVKLP